MRATSRLSVAAEQCFTVLVLLAVGVYGFVDQLSIGLPLAVAAALVLVVLLGRVGALVESRHHRAVDLIAQGRGTLPVVAVVRARRRLLEPSDRERLARTLDVIRAEVRRPGAAGHRVQPLYNVSVVRAVSSELGRSRGSCGTVAGCAVWPARSSSSPTVGRHCTATAMWCSIRSSAGSASCLRARTPTVTGMGITPHSEPRPAAVACEQVHREPR